MCPLGGTGPQQEVHVREQRALPISSRYGASMDQAQQESPNPIMAPSSSGDPEGCVDAKGVGAA